MSKVYEIVTKQIEELLEKNETPWTKPWVQNIGTQKNYQSGRAYTGFNAFVLALRQKNSPYWLTFNQIKSAGIKLKKGSKAVNIVGWFDANKDKDDDSEDSQKELRVRYYKVFNLSDCEELTDAMIKKLESLKPITFEHDPIEKAEELFKLSGAKLEIGGAVAFYSPVKDYIGMPPMSYFKNVDEYYSTLFHELTHWTGHKSRLNRKDLTTKARFASEEYSHEELCAEMGAVYVCSSLGISTDSSLRNSSAYIKGWLKFIKDNPKAFVMACQRAQKAADLILNKNK